SAGNVLKDRFGKYLSGVESLKGVLKGLARTVVPPPYARGKGKERGYVYFQEFVGGNDSDIRVVVIGGRAFAIRRMVRKNDFRASGSGRILYDPAIIPLSAVAMAFELAGRME